MQGIVKLTRQGVAELVEFIFGSGEPAVSQAYSGFDLPLRKFLTALDLVTDINSEFGCGRKFVSYAVYFPDTKGHVLERRITLNPQRCEGHTWRYAVEGWGVFQLQLELKPDGLIECRVAVNGPKRAAVWADTILDFQDPDQWDWKAVEGHAGRIIRRMKKISKSASGSKLVTAA